MSAFPSKSPSDNRKSAIQNPKWAGIFAIALTFVFGGAVAQAQQPTKIFRIGYLDASTATGTAVLLTAFRQAPSKFGWIEGKNIAIEYRFAEQKNERLSELAANLVRLKVDLLVVAGAPPTVAAKEASITIPIVMAFSGIQWLWAWSIALPGRAAMSPGFRPWLLS